MAKLHSDTEDAREIRALINRQVASLSWNDVRRANWPAFESDFLPAAILFPSARPVTPQSVATFVQRMKLLVAGTVNTFHEEVIGTTINVFGHIAVAVVACEVTENSKDMGRIVEMILLVKENDVWRIAAQAWEKSTPSRRVPPSLIGVGRGR